MTSFTDHRSLQDLSPLRTGGIAEYSTTCKTLASLLDSLQSARAQSLDYQVLGSASAVLLSDGGFSGVIIFNQASNITPVYERSQFVVESGTSLQQLVTTSVTLGYSGLEGFSGLAGTLGGALYNGVTSCGRSIVDYVKSATLLHPEKLPNTEMNSCVQRVDRDWFTTSKGEPRLRALRQRGYTHVPVILSVTLQLSRMTPATCLQKLHEFQRFIPSRPVGQPALEVFRHLRYAAQSFHPVERSRLERAELADSYVAVDKRKVIAWREGGIAAWPTNPNYFINTGMGTSREARTLIERICTETDQSLQPAIEYVGVW